MTCQKCELYKDSLVNCMQGAGPSPCRVMFISDGINHEEELYKQPFQGTTGRVFENLLSSVGLLKSQFYLTSCIKCRATIGKGEFRKNRAAKVAEVKACAEYLDKEIELVKPELIVCLGSTAAKRILGKIEIQQGEFTDCERYNCTVLYTYHPAMALRDPGVHLLLKKHYMLLARYLKGESVEVPKINYVCADTKEVLDEVVDRLNSVDVYAFDIETTGFDLEKDKLISIGFSWKSGTGVAIPLVHQDGSPCWEDYSWLKQVLENKALKIAHNMKFEYKFLKANGIVVNNLSWDTMIAHYLLDENSEHGLKNLAWLYTEYGGYDAGLEKYKKDHKFKKKESYLKIPFDILLPYNAMDCAVTFELYEKFTELMRKENLTWMYEHLMIPFQQLLIKMELRGAYIDKVYLEQLRTQFNEQAAQLRIQFTQQTAFYGNYNLNSSIQLRDLFFNKLGIKSIKKVKGSDSDSTDKEVMKVLAETNPIAKLILDVKKLEKKDKYLKKILEGLDADSRVHTEYSLTREVTGRIASSKPNLQNCNKEKEMRNIFVATPGYKMAEYDMSQWEIRVLTGITQDVGFLKIFAEGGDIHTAVACRVFKVKPEDVTDKMRMAAKAINFGISYGRGKFTLAEALHVSIEEAEEYLKQWFTDHPQIGAWVKEMQRQALHNRYVSHILGRRRRFPNVDTANPAQLNEIKRQAINSPVQGLASDIVCLAAIRIDARFRGESIDGHIVLSVHDALVCEIREEQYTQGCKIIQEELERRVPGLDIDPKAEGKFGYKWGEIAKQEDVLLEDEETVEDPEEDESEQN